MKACPQNHLLTSLLQVVFIYNFCSACNFSITVVSVVFYKHFLAWWITFSFTFILPCPIQIFLLSLSPPTYHKLFMTLANLSFPLLGSLFLFLLEWHTIWSSANYILISSKYCSVWTPYCLKGCILRTHPFYLRENFVTYIPTCDLRVLGYGAKEAEVKSVAIHSPTAVGFWHLLKGIRSELNGVECFLNAPLII